MFSFSRIFKSKTKRRRRPTVGLALSGGSTFGIAHVGVLQALTEAQVPIDYISGTSSGALVAGCFAFGMPVEEMVAHVRNLNWRRLSRFGYSRLGLHSNKPMGTFITDLLGDVDIQDARVPLAIVATNIELQEMVTLRTGSLHEAIRASTCIPGVFTPVELQGALLVDGTLSENLPLTPLRDMGAEMTIGVIISADPTLVRPKHVFDVLMVSFNMLLSQRDMHLPVKPDVLIEPHISMHDTLQFANTDHLISEGYRVGRQAVPSIMEMLASRV